MKKKLAVLGASAVAYLMPAAAFAQDLAMQCAGTSLLTGEGFICKIYSLTNLVMKFLILVGVAYFIWGVVQFIQGGGEEKEDGRDKLVKGIIGLAVILGLWGLVTVVLNTFGVGGGTVNQNAFPIF